MLTSPFKSQSTLDLEYKMERFLTSCAQMVGINVGAILTAVWKAMVYISRYSSNNIDITSNWEVQRVYLVLNLLADIIIAENGDKPSS